MLKLSITVIVTCYNLHNYLDECIQSIYDQTMPPTEIIIVHDGCEKPPVFAGTVTLVHDKNRGVSRSRNEAVNLAASDWILFVDGDDAIESYFIEGMINTYKKTDAHIIYPNVVMWRAWGQTPGRNTYLEMKDVVTKETMKEANLLTVSSLIQRYDYIDCGGMRDYPILEDYDFWLRMLDYGCNTAKSPQSVLKYRHRQHSRNANAELKNEYYHIIKEEHYPLERKEEI